MFIIWYCTQGQEQFNLFYVPGLYYSVADILLANGNELSYEATKCGFIAQMVEHRTGIAEVTGLNPVEALIFSGFVFPIASIGKLTAMIILHLNYFI